MTAETVETLPINRNSMYSQLHGNSLPTQSIIHISQNPLVSSISSTPSISSIPFIEDLSCNMINVRATCKGSLQIATIPPLADIYIYEESQGDYILRTEKTGTMSHPATINDIECTGPTRSNKFKLTFPNYVDVEGMLDITDGTIYQLYIIMEQCPPSEPVSEMGGDILLSALAIGGLIFFLFGGDKKKRRFEDYDKYKEIYE